MSTGLELKCFTAAPHPERPVVVTGAFDVLHVGHLMLLREAHRRRHPLAVGVEDDDRVRAWKGDTRPVNTAADRVEMLAELRCVDAVFVISGDPSFADWHHYLEILRPLTPVALALTEGDPFAAEKRHAAVRMGAQVWEVPHVPKRSTSAIVRRMTS